MLEYDRSVDVTYFSWSEIKLDAVLETFAFDLHCCDH